MPFLTHDHFLPPSFIFIFHLFYYIFVLITLSEDVTMILIELYNGRIVYGGGARRSLRASD